MVDSNKFRFAIGDTNSFLNPTNGAGFGLAAGHVAVNSGGGSALGATAAIGLGSPADATHVDANGLDVFMLASYEPGLGISRYGAYNTLTGATIITAASDGDLNISSFTPWPALRFSGVELYMAVYYEFGAGALPADWFRASWWMADNARRGDRYLWPGQGW